MFEYGFFFQYAFRDIMAWTAWKCVTALTMPHVSTIQETACAGLAGRVNAVVKVISGKSC